jgi:DNA (cytosine-5)-methyltransferase 1
MLTHGSLCSGIEGNGLGFYWAGIPTLFHVDNRKFCQRVIEKNKAYWPNAKLCSDIYEVGGQDLEKVDIISAGFPCQNISGAGKKTGLNGTKSRVFWQVRRIFRERRPTWGLLENVSRLVRTADIDTVLSAMESAGYRCWPFLLDARLFGATHKRQRVFILCKRADTCGHERIAASWVQNLEAAQRTARAAAAKWQRRMDELRAHPGPAGADAYARISRECHGIPRWLDRHRALGNSVVPIIPYLFGMFMQSVEAKEEK